ncbi:MAG: hypothetical protein ACOYLE_00145 [Bacteroidales bacterium]
METIKTLIIDNIPKTILLIVLETLVIIIILIISTKKKKRFRVWKKDTLDLVVYKREWEHNTDEFINELFSENEKLESENKLLKRQFKKVSILFLIVLIIDFFKEKFSKSN